MGTEANVYVKKQILAFEGENYFNMLWIKYFTVPWKSPCFFIFPVCFAEIFYLIFSEKSIISAGSFIFLVFKRLHCALKITWISLLWLNYCIGSYTDKNPSIHKPEHDQIYVTNTTILFRTFLLLSLIPYGKLSNVDDITWCNVFTRLNLHPV